MTDPQRMKQLNEAWEFVDSASHDEKKELFKRDIQEFEKRYARFDTPDNRFDSYSDNAYYAMYHLEFFFTRLTGYSASWIPDKHLEHCCENSGRRAKYSRDTRSDNCFFITQMVERGASETQAMKLLIRLQGNKAITSGHLRELQDSYRDYKKIEGLREDDLSIIHNGHMIARFLEFSITNLEGDEIASQKAVNAFRSFFQELIDLMKKSHETIAVRDKSYPEIFGCVIDWINSEYEDPLDYFFTHETHKSVDIWHRRKGLREYINTISAFRDEIF